MNAKDRVTSAVIDAAIMETAAEAAYSACKDAAHEAASEHLDEWMRLADKALDSINSAREYRRDVVDFWQTHYGETR